MRETRIISNFSLSSYEKLLSYIPYLLLEVFSCLVPKSTVVTLLQSEYRYLLVVTKILKYSAAEKKKLYCLRMPINTTGLFDVIFLTYVAM